MDPLRREALVKLRTAVNKYGIQDDEISQQALAALYELEIEEARERGAPVGGEGKA